MKIGFYLENKNTRNIDYSNPENGNPGIGGSEYMIWTISYYLKKIYDRKLEVYILANNIETLPRILKNIQCESIECAINKSKELKLDLFIFKGPIENEKIFRLIDNVKQPSAMWSHNFETKKSLKYAMECKYLVKNICVSKEQYDRLRDHDIFTKSTYIYNALDFNLYNYEKIEVVEKDNIVSYMGAITPAKGFHKLAEVWNHIERKVPDAKLYIIGGGNLYNKNTELGKYKIAESKYEDKFINPFLDESGNIKDNIKFLGVLSQKEKLDIMAKSKVGVVNPTGKGETFCISAIEFQSVRVPVVTRNKFGLINTVNNNKTGILVNNKKDLEKKIINLLLDNELNNYMGNNAEKFVRNEFDIYKLCCEWFDLVENIVENKEVKPEFKTSNYYNDMKFIREINRRVKKIKIFNRFPSLIEYNYYLKKIIGKK